MSWIVTIDVIVGRRRGLSSGSYDHTKRTMESGLGVRACWSRTIVVPGERLETGEASDECLMWQTKIAHVFEVDGAVVDDKGMGGFIALGTRFLRRKSQRIRHAGDVGQFSLNTGATGAGGGVGLLDGIYPDGEMCSVW